MTERYSLTPEACAAVPVVTDKAVMTCKDSISSTHYHTVLAAAWPRWVCQAASGVCKGCKEMQVCEQANCISADLASIVGYTDKHVGQRPLTAVLLQVQAPKHIC
jgi:hypothetical protein